MFHFKKPSSPKVDLIADRKMHFLSNDNVNRKDRRKVNNEDVIFTKKLTFLYDMSTCHQISTEINIEDTFNPIKFWEVRGWRK